MTLADADRAGMRCDHKLLRAVIFPLSVLPVPQKKSADWRSELPLGGQLCFCDPDVPGDASIAVPDGHSHGAAQNASGGIADTERRSVIGLEPNGLHGLVLGIEIVEGLETTFTPLFLLGNGLPFRSIFCDPLRRLLRTKPQDMADQSNDVTTLAIGKAVVDAFFRRDHEVAFATSLADRAFTAAFRRNR